MKFAICTLAAMSIYSVTHEILDLIEILHQEPDLIVLSNVYLVVSLGIALSFITYGAVAMLSKEIETQKNEK